MHLLLLCTDSLLQTVTVNLMQAEKPRHLSLKLFKPLLITLKKLSSLP